MTRLPLFSAAVRCVLSKLENLALVTEFALHYALSEFGLINIGEIRGRLIQELVRN